MGFDYNFATFFELLSTFSDYDDKGLSEMTSLGLLNIKITIISFRQYYNINVASNIRGYSRLRNTPIITKKEM